MFLKTPPIPNPSHSERKLPAFRIVIVLLSVVLTESDQIVEVNP